MKLLIALLVLAAWIGATALAAWAVPPRGGDEPPDLSVDPHWLQRTPYNPVHYDRVRPGTRATTTTSTTTSTAAPKPAPRTTKSRPPPAVVSGTCSDWLAAAHVDDVGSAVGLINRESGCNPYAVNRRSGACGVAQELPCGKSGCALGNGACQVAWMDGYIHTRYGSWANALAFQISHGWY